MLEGIRLIWWSLIGEIGVFCLTCIYTNVRFELEEDGTVRSILFAVDDLALSKWRNLDD